MSKTQRGRPPTVGISPSAKSIRLSADHWHVAQEAGNGNVAAGIRRALDHYEKTLIRWAKNRP